MRGPRVGTTTDRVLLGVAVGSASAVIVYALLRTIERAFFPEPNPAVLIWAEQSNYVWRSIIALYVGGACGFGGYALSGRSALATTRLTSGLVVVAVLGLIAQSLGAP